tara:strand:+ start:470 stop:1048 length:579 start_codon:yes stop_codon:yes gene_type:complete
MDKLPEIIEAPVENLDNNINMEIVDEEDPVEDDIMPEVIPKPILEQKEIFKSKDDRPLSISKVKKPKREISDKQRENLKIAREKALQKRQENAKLRKTGELPTKKEKEIQDKKPIVNNIIHETKNITNNISKEDIEIISAQASKKALEDYEMVRKHRKAEKKERQKVETEKEKIRQTLEKATKVNDPYSFCY